MTAPAVTPDLTLSDDLPCRDCGCPAHSSRQSRLDYDWHLCNEHEDGQHEAGTCDPKGEPPPRACGNYNGYKRHLSRREPVCGECRKAARAHWRTEGEVRHKPCGTEAAYRRHIRAGEKPCIACSAADSSSRSLRKARSST